ncbi:hypothetical protein [Paenibacillus sp. UMB4589-SE434]|uniref:hypothetical protein n=1 Tax=Paenibacillus sp. UMB4589-SE434 TaxID=3046314 RepID=UPI00254D8AE6|nr:hypothetical protein [Paenibacillus sp. UMB4589-SE434]MDK8183490.1 hypothetical protein [Paenibacillus sp. UMB4589-SE434]
MKIMKRLIFMLLLLLISMSFPLSAAAISVVWSDTTQAAFNKILSAAPPAYASRLQSAHNSLVTQQGQERQLDTDIAAQHARNSQNEAAVRKQIKSIDTNQLHQLEKRVQDARSRHKPLQAYYTSLQQQITVARKLKQTEFAAALRVQADIVKVTVQLAREDIRMCELAYTKAKQSAAQAMKRVRTTLSDAVALRAKITSSRQTVVSLNKLAPSVLKPFRQAVKAADAKACIDALTPIVSHSRQIVEQKQHIMSLQKDIANVILKAHSQLKPSA